MHVVLFIPSIESGGVERNAVLVANYLVGEGFPVSVAHVRANPAVQAQFRPGVAMWRLGMRWRVPGIHPRLMDALVILPMFCLGLLGMRRERPVVLSFQSNTVAILAGLLTRVPVAVRLSNHPDSARFERSLLRKVSERIKPVSYRFASAVIANSEELGTLFRKMLRTPVITIYNPIDGARLEPLAREPAPHPWLEQKALPVVTAVGRLTAQKDFATLIRAFALVSQRMRARLILIGEGEQRAELEQLARALGIADCVAFTGHLGNVHAFVARSDLFVLSSRYEGMPNALAEAIAVGTPAVSTDCNSGPREILLDGRGGDLVPVGDPATLAEAIVRNLGDEGYRRGKWQEASRKLDDFDFARVMPRYVQLLRALDSGLPPAEAGARGNPGA